MRTKKNDMEVYHRRPLPHKWCAEPADTRQHLTNVFEESTLKVLALFEAQQTLEMYLCPISSWGKKTVKLTPLTDSTWWARRPKPGSHWQHVKGNTYGVVGNAVHVVTGKHYVVYKSDLDKVVWAREASAWFETVDGRSRFTLIP